MVGMYAPAVNIHRTPYSGHNFEYYSEDALLSGKLGAAMVRGYYSQGVYAYVKHFALNDQESNRLSISVWSNEQAMRELHLKAFEVVVKEGRATAMMSSYSYLGGTWTENEDGTLSLTGSREFTVNLADGVYKMEVSNVETGIVCKLRNTV